MELAELNQADIQSLISLPKVELHLHLDGMISAGLIYETAVRRDMPLPSHVSTAEDLIPYITMPPFSRSLTDCLRVFHFFTPIIKGDRIAIRQMTVDACDYLVANNILYAELRFCPQLLQDDNLSASEIVSIVCDTMTECSRHYDIHVRFLLCAIRDRPEWTHEIVDLAHQFREKGMAGIDLAGDEQHSCMVHAEEFTRAKALGLKITVHAGEAGPGQGMIDAITELHADRIGHGYRCVDSDHVYEIIKQSGVHLECCLTSSLQTGAVQVPLSEHPVVQFARDGIDFSLSTDDPTVFSSTLNQEYALAYHEVGLRFDTITNSIRNAMSAAFCHGSERVMLQKRIDERIEAARSKLNRVWSE